MRTLTPAGKFWIIYFALLFVCGAALAHDRKA